MYIHFYFHNNLGGTSHEIAFMCWCAVKKLLTHLWLISAFYSGLLALFSRSLVMVKVYRWCEDVERYFPFSSPHFPSISPLLPSGILRNCREGEVRNCDDCLESMCKFFDPTFSGMFCVWITEKSLTEILPFFLRGGSYAPCMSTLLLLPLSAVTVHSRLPRVNTLKPGFHWPCWRPELTGDRFPLHFRQLG